MEWIELLIAGVVGLITSTYLISLILQASHLVDRTRERFRKRPPTPGKYFGTALAKALILLVLVLGVLQELGVAIAGQEREGTA